MNLHRLSRAAVFLAGTVVGGLALAFILVYIDPRLLLRTAPRGVSAPTAAAPAGTAPPPAPGRATPSSVVQVTESFAAAVRRAAPAVVNISTARLVTEQLPPSPIAQLFGDFWPRYVQQMQRALGSGVIIDASGHILTNYHVIRHANIILVQLADGRIARATVIGTDPDTDLAVLQIHLTHLPVIVLGRSDQLQVGDPVLAIGDPLGLSETVTHGIVSAKGRSQLGVATFENFIQTDAAINAGNSGGALVNTRGELVGINTAVLTRAGTIGVEGIGFAIPVNLARGVVDQILRFGHVVRGWIGIVPEDVSSDQARALGLARGGVVIVNLYRNSPAIAANVHVGDVLTALNGRRVLSAQDALEQIARMHPGALVTLQLQRAGAALRLSMRVRQRPTSG